MNQGTAITQQEITSLIFMRPDFCRIGAACQHGNYQWIIGWPAKLIRTFIRTTTAAIARTTRATLLNGSGSAQYPTSHQSNQKITPATTSQTTAFMAPSPEIMAKAGVKIIPHGITAGGFVNWGAYCLVGMLHLDAPMKTTLVLTGWR